MDKYIKQEAALDEIVRFVGYIDQDMIYRIQTGIAKIPAADVVEVRHGQWINERREGLSSFSAECSLCEKRTLAYFHYFYCPNCGARIDGGQDDV